MNWLAGIGTKLLGLLKGPAGWLFSFALEWAWGKVKEILEKQRIARESKAIREDNLKRYDEALKKGDKDELAKSAEDLLNGIDNRSR